MEVHGYYHSSIGPDVKGRRVGKAKRGDGRVLAGIGVVEENG